MRLPRGLRTQEHVEIIHGQFSDVAIEIPKVNGTTRYRRVVEGPRGGQLYPLALPILNSQRAGVGSVRLVENRNASRRFVVGKIGHIHPTRASVHLDAQVIAIVHIVSVHIDEVGKCEGAVGRREARRLLRRVEDLRLIGIPDEVV